MFKAVDISPRLAGRRRILICGGPRTGKSTLAVRLGERHGLEVRHGDSIISDFDWSGASQEVSTWIDDSKEWVIEGVVLVRALRKWLAQNPGRSLDATVVYFERNIQVQTPKQEAMSKGIHTVWLEILPDLVSRGVDVVYRDA